MGLNDGSIMRIWINNIFPICVYNHTCGIRCLDLSSEQSQLAAVDEEGHIFIYDLKVIIVICGAFGEVDDIVSSL